MNNYKKFFICLTVIFLMSFSLFSYKTRYNIRYKVDSYTITSLEDDFLVWTKYDFSLNEDDSLDIIKNSSKYYLVVFNGEMFNNHFYSWETFGSFDLSNMLTSPHPEAHGVVWKVVVNGYDAQDEYELLPPLGVGKHKFEVYFNRPMNKAKAPIIAMGVRPPYTQTAIAEEGAWNDEGKRKGEST